MNSSSKKNNSTVYETLWELCKANWQRIALIALLAVYTFFVFFKIGDFSMPYSSFRFNTAGTEEAANEVIVELTFNKDAGGNAVALDSVWVHAGTTGVAKNTTATVKFSYAASISGTYYTSALGELKFCDSSSSANFRMQKWTNAFKDVSINGTAYKYFKITTTYGIALNELVFLDKNDQIITASVVAGPHSAAALFDEQQKLTFITSGDKKAITGNGKLWAVNDRMNWGIFDEYYFPPAAQAYLDGTAPYIEYSHPPLGKIILSAGIAMFGMNTFGMRFMPAVFAVLTVLAVYFLGKTLFSSKTGGVIFALIYAASGMQISLGRIGTTDSFLVFFVVLAYQQMLTFLKNGIDDNKRLLSCVPLLFSGLCFGCAASIKWSGIVTGVGLFILFCLFLVKEIVTFVKQNKACAEGEEALSVASLLIKLAIACCVAGLAFIVLAFGLVYFGSFAVVGDSYRALFKTESIWEAFWENQKYVLNFHTGNMKGDYNSSAWWGWLVNEHSTCFYKGDSYNDGVYNRMHCMGSMLVYLASFVSMLFLGVQILCTKLAKNPKQSDVTFTGTVEKPYYFLLIAFLGMYLPWAFVTRPMYNYTFLSPSVFYCGFLATYLIGIMQTYRKPVKKTTVGNLITFIMLGICAVNFLMFYPAFAGIPVSEAAAAVLFGWSTLRTYPFMIPL